VAEVATLSAAAAEWEARYQTLAGLVAPLIDVARAADRLSHNVNEFGEVTDESFWLELHDAVDRLRAVGGLPILGGRPAVLAVLRPLPLGDPDDDPGLRVAPL
jgi:hypothetical protein